MPEEDLNLLYAVSRIILRGDSGTLVEQIKIKQNSQISQS